MSGIPTDAETGYQFAHRGRLGTDTMMFRIADAATNAVLFSRTGRNPRTFSYGSSSASGGNPTIGNSWMRRRSAGSTSDRKD